MTTALEHLRQTLDLHATDRAWARLWALRGQEGPPSREARGRFAWLQAESGREAMLEVVERGGLTPPSLARLQALRMSVETQAQVARASWPLGEVLRRRDEQGMRPGDWLAALTVEPDGVVRAASLRGVLQYVAPAANGMLVAGLEAEAGARAQVGEVGEVGEAGEVVRAEHVTWARTFLRETEAAARDLIAYMARPGQGPAGLDLAAALYGLRAAELDGVLGTGGRGGRATTLLQALGLGRHGANRLRVEPDPVGLWGSHPLALGVPGDVRLIAGEALPGALGEWSWLGALGQGLALSLTNPTLPCEDRWPLVDGAATFLGGLFQQWLPDPVFLRSVYRVSGSQVGRVQRVVLAGMLFWARLACHWLVVAGEYPTGPAPTTEEAGAALAAVVGAPVGVEANGLLGCLPRVAHGRVWGLLHGMAIHGALRDRFDEDYFRNPRFHEVLLGMAQRGNTLDGETLRLELGVVLEDFQARLRDWY